MSATKTAYKNFVGGKWVDASSGETMDVINPSTGETVAEVPRCGAEDVDHAVEAANAALPGWLDSTPKERSELLLKLASVLEDNAEELAQLESLNVGKPLMASRDEMPFSADTCASSPAPRAISRASRRASTSPATPRSCAASRWGS
jgi:betaine-aldehyde dehydrogenase